MTRLWKLVAAALLVALACSNPEGLRRGTGSLAIRIVLAGGGGTPLDSGYVRVQGSPKDTTVKVIPGDTAKINNIPGGTYTVSLEGFSGGAVAYFGQVTGVTVTNGQTTTTTVPVFGALQAAVTPLPAYTTNGQFTFVYNKVALAASYVVQKDTLATFATSHDSAVSPNTDTSVALSIPPTGPWYVRVIAVDPLGKRGTPSASDSITTLTNCCVVAPAGATITSAAGTQAFTVSGKDAKGNVIVNVAATWSSLNANVASVAAGTGVATAVGQGQSTIVAAVTGIAATPSGVLTVATPTSVPVNVWSAQAIGTSQSIRAAWGVGPNDLFAVAESAGLVLHYNGTTWSHVATGSSAPLLAIWGSSDADVFAVGYGGAVLHYNGSSWSAMTTNIGAHLYRVWGSGPSDVFAVGDTGHIVHYNGTAWSNMASGTSNQLTGVWGSAANDVFAVGISGTILHYNGTAWSAMTSGTANTLYGVRGTGSGDVYAVSSSGTIHHYNGTSWSQMSSPAIGTYLWDVWAMSPTEAYATAGNGTVLVYNGSTWTVMFTSSSLGFLGDFGAPSGDVYVVGFGGELLHGIRGAPFQAFGYPNRFTSTGNVSGGYLLGDAFTLSSKIELTTFGEIVGNAPGRVQMALYTDSAGSPYHLVAESPGTSGAAGTGTIEFAARQQTQLQPGTYWVMAISDSLTSTINSTATTTEEYTALAYGSALPSPFPRPPGSATYPIFNYYVKGYVVP